VAGVKWWLSKAGDARLPRPARRLLTAEASRGRDALREEGRGAKRLPMMTGVCWSVWSWSGASMRKAKERQNTGPPSRCG
jgi:hypothetical protein